jgi:protein arginine N-methyltransferase 1
MKFDLRKHTKKKRYFSRTRTDYNPKDYSISYQEINRDIFDHLREHEYMLTDRPRVDTYHTAISRTVKPGDTVIDLGTGVGILAFFAAGQGAKKVYAIDHSKIILVAEQVAQHNQIKNVEFLQIHSKKFTLDSPVDVIIHEQMGNFLLDEDMVDNICDLRDRLLKKDGRIIPDKFELYIEPVKILDSLHVPLIREMNIHDIDFSCLKENADEGDYSFLWRDDPATIEYFLCDPQPIYSLNLKTVNPEDIPNELEYVRVVKHAGRLDGLIVYFRCSFDEELEITTGPFQNRASHWKYWLLRVESQLFKEGDRLYFKLEAEDLRVPTTWHWFVG